MKKFGLSVLAALLCCISLCLFGGCSDGCGQSTGNAVSAEIVGVKELKFKAGEATDENILKDVKVVLSDGRETKPALNKNGATLNEAGRYEISYEYNSVSVNGVVYVYDVPKVYYEGQVLSDDTVSLTYIQAAQSYDFTKNITIKDSFGVELKVNRDGDEFKNKAGEYTVTYTATDEVGNVCEKSIKYVVIGGDEPAINDYSYVVSMNECFVPWDLKNNTRITAYMDGDIINPLNYVVGKDGLKFDTEYILSVGVGEKTVVIETENGSTEFKLTITDEGNPVFAFDVNSEYIYGGIGIPEPQRLIPSHGEYEYSYSVKDASNKEYLVKNHNGEIYFTDENDDVILPGDYDVTVNCNYNGKKSSVTRSFSVVYATVSGGESVFLTKEKFSEPLGGVTEAYKFIKSAGSSAWYGRLYYDCPLGAYSMASFDIYLTSSSAAGADGKANVVLSCCVDLDYRRITSVTDKASGKEIPEEDMLLNRWYTVTVYAYTEKSGALYVYFNPYSEDSIACEGYITGEKFVPLKGLTAVSFVKNSDSQCVLKQTIENGEMVVSYVSNGIAYDSRIQFTEKMLGCYNDNFVNGSNPKLKFSICFTGEDKDIQFWSIVSAGYGNCPTLGGLLNGGYATMSKGGVNVTSLEQVEKGEWYDVSIDIAAFGEIILRNPDCGLQMGSTGSFKFKNVTFGKDQISDSGETLVIGDDNCKHWQF